MQETWEVSNDSSLIEKLLSYIQLLHFYAKAGQLEAAFEKWPVDVGFRKVEEGGFGMKNFKNKFLNLN